MIAFVLRETGRDPAWLIGAPVPQLGVERRLRRRATSSSRATSRTARSSRCRPRSPSSRTSSSTTTPSSRRSPSCVGEFDAWLARARHVVRDAPPFDGELAVPGEHNRLNAGAALAALERGRRARASEAAPALARFTGTGRRFEVARARRRDRRRRLRPPSDRDRARRSRRRASAFRARRVRVLFQPHLYSRTRHLASELAAALAGADDVTVTDIYARARAAACPA